MQGEVQIHRVKRIFAPLCVLFACSTLDNQDIEKLVSDGLLSSPPVWSFFVPYYSGTSTVFGKFNASGWSQATLAPGGNPFVVLDPRTADLTLTSGYCPPRSTTREFVSIQGRDVAGSVVEGILAIAIYSPWQYVQSCQIKPVQAPTTPAPDLLYPNVSLALKRAPSLVAIPDASFTVDGCQAGSSAPTVVGSFLAKFSPNVDFSKLRMTISSRIFQPVLPVVCDPDFQCNVTIVLSRPIDQSMLGVYIIPVNYGGGGLLTTSQQLVISVLCNALNFERTTSMPPSTGTSDPPLIVPELPPCSVETVSIIINEDTPVGTVVTNLPSIPSPGFRFQINDASATGYFNISDQGTITLARPLSAPTDHTVHLRVAGQVTNQSVCGTDVFIGILNVNLRKPGLDQGSYSFTVDCNNSSNPVGTVSTSDSDRGRNNIRRFFLNTTRTGSVGAGFRLIKKFAKNSTLEI
ncbi:uncharacterized protein LOC129591092 isoform X2 [Paramacrobiotus metropolitanus]|uniref:uncharacterized protein LOC129591092 isoform X2 n=1 Tax=Paramacrobiotus metropolitanus TaxID=2943436 RepID=UPI0024460E32|nr:uncharacterized protein LOC129591092 isoform X2 [Paramacrobiotus metropolitanus]